MEYDKGIMVLVVVQNSYHVFPSIRNKIMARITGFSDFGHRPIFQKLKNKIFRKLDLFPFLGEGELTYSVVFL
jgi:hypothetical protein